MTDPIDIVERLRKVLADDPHTPLPWIEAGPSYGQPLPMELTSVVTGTEPDSDCDITICRDAVTPDVVLICAAVNAAPLLLAEITRLRAALATWESAITAVMPDDLKDWHENSRAEWPAVAAGVITALRADRDEGWRLAAQVPQWLPIESAPKDGTPVDLWRAEWRERAVNMRRVELSAGNVFYEPVGSGPSVVRDATHWMPLPAAPGASLQAPADTQPQGSNVGGNRQ